MSSLAERLKSVRGELSREEFAQAIGVHVNTVGRYERGESEPDISIASKICREFDVSPHWLMLGEGPQGLSHSHDGVPTFYEKDGLGHRVYIPIDKDIEFIEAIIDFTLKENDMELSKKEVSAIANLYYEEMKNRILAIALKVKEISNPGVRIRGYGPDGNLVQDNLKS